jgi:hypothetical protein
MAETAEHEAVKGKEAGEKVGPGKALNKKNLKWYAVGALAAIAVLVFFFTRKSNSNATASNTAATSPTSTDGLDPATISTLESLGLLGNSSSTSSGYGGGSGSWWGGGGGSAIATTPTTSSTGTSTTAPTTTTGSTTSTGTGTSTTTGSPLPAQSGGQLEYVTTGGQTLAQIASALGTTAQTLISDTISGHGDVNNGAFSNWLKTSNMGSKGNVPSGLKLFYTPAK